MKGRLGGRYDWNEENRLNQFIVPLIITRFLDQQNWDAIEDFSWSVIVSYILSSRSLYRLHLIWSVFNAA